MRRVQPTRHDTAAEDDYPESELVPGLGFNGTLTMIGRFLRRLFTRSTPTH